MEISLRKIIFWGCCVFALSLPFDFSLKHIFLDIPLIKSFLILWIIILCFLWQLLIIVNRKLDIKLPPLFLPIFIFFIIHIFSALVVSSNTVWSLKYTFRFFGLGLIYFILVNFIENERQLKIFINCLLIGAALSALCVILQYFFPYSFISIQNFFEDAKVSPHRVRGLFGWPTSMSCYLGSFLPIVLSFLFYKPDKRSWEKIFYFLLVFIIMVGLVLSGTRGWILGLFSSLCFLWFLDSLRKKDYFILGLVLVILILGVAFNFKGIEKFMKSQIEVSEQARITFFKEAIKVFREHPIRGIGTDMFYWRHTPGFRAHNLFFEVLANLGIIGFLVLVWFLYAVFKSISKNLTKKQYQEIYFRIGMITSLVSFLAHQQVDYFLNLHEFIGLFWVLLGIGICSLKIEKEV